MFLVTGIPAADPEAAQAHFSDVLTHYTDAYSVYLDTSRGSSQIRLIDVRERADFVAGHLPGALHMPLTEVARRGRELIPHDAVAVCYCSSAGCLRAVAAARSLAELEVPVKVLLGGYEAWRHYNYPVQTGA